MRCLPGLLAAMLATAAAGEDLLADLRAEVEAITATATLKPAEATKGDGGPAYRHVTVKLAGDEATYGLLYKSFLPPNEHRNRTELNDFASGLGMNLPSAFGWYSNGFVDVVLKDAKQSCAIGDRCGQVALVRDSGKVIAADCTWRLANGTVRLRFLLLANRPELFLSVTARADDPAARLEVVLRCYPGGFTSPFDRRVHTSGRELVHQGEAVADHAVAPVAEPWLILADHYPGLTMRPMGPCTVAVDPTGIEAAGVTIRGNYGVEPHYRTKAGVLAALLALREFPPTTWQNARDEVAATFADGLAAAGAALAGVGE